MKKDTDFKENKTFEKTKIFYGPRRKTLLTYFLETICYAFLSDKETQIFSSFEEIEEEKYRIVSINKKKFNLTKILRASPDFEHIYFTDQQHQEQQEIIQRRDGAKQGSRKQTALQ